MVGLGLLLGWFTEKDLATGAAGGTGRKEAPHQR